MKKILDVIKGIYFLDCLLITMIIVVIVIIRRKKVDYFDLNIKQYSINLLESLINKLIKILFFLAILLLSNLLYKLIILIGIIKYINIISVWAIENEGISSSILGAFLASLLGIITQVMINMINRRKEQSINSRILYNELKHIIYRFDVDYNTKNIYDKKYPDLFDRFYKRINYDSNWREHYSYLTNKLSNEYYDKILEIYSAVEAVNSAIDSKNFNQLINVISDFKFLDNTAKIPFEGIDINSTDLIDALQRLSKNKKVKSKTIFHLINELKIRKLRKNYFNIIENKIYNLLLSTKETDSKIIKDKIKKWLRESNKNFKKIDEKMIDNAIFYVSMKSKKFKLVWDEYSLSKN